MLLVLAFAAGAQLVHAQAGCCATNGGPSGACSAAGLVVCVDGTTSACVCGSGTSTPPTLGQLAMPEVVPFGSITVGATSLPVTTRITNVGALAVTVTGLTSGAPDEFTVVRNDCSVLSGGGSCTVDVVFRPWIGGPRSTLVRVTSTGVGGPPGFTVVATGFVPTASTPPPAANAPTLDVIEYAHAAWDHYFVTAVPGEIRKLDDGTFAGWKRTGLKFKAYTNGLPGTVSMCRFFSTAFAPRSSHFYTSSASECAAVKANPNWSFEGDVFGVVLPSAAGVCPGSLLPLYRLYNGGRGGAPNHRYTQDAGVRAIMIAFGWVPEGTGPLGVIACTPP